MYLQEKKKFIIKNHHFQGILLVIKNLFEFIGYFLIMLILLNLLYKYI